MEKNQKWLLRNFHALCSRAGLSSDEKRQLIESYGCVSSKDMSDEDLKDVCLKLEMQTNPAIAELNRCRKRVIAAIAAYLRMCRKEESIELIKAVACRATHYDRFNDIPAERLRNVYYAFVNRTRDMEASYKEMEDLLLCK